MRRSAGPILAALAIALSSPATAPAQTADAPAQVRAAVLRVDRGPALPISRLDLPPDDLGFAGGRLATEDNQTTGRFMGQQFLTEDVDATPDTAVAALETLISAGTTFIAVMAGPDTLLALSQAAGDRALIVNATAQDTRLRNADCRANVMHVAPSRAMLTDALAQFLVWKKWTDWFLVPGSHPEDQALAEAYRASARKFGAKIVEERVFEDTGGARRTDTGHVLVQRQIPVFTQRAEDHDVVIAADEADVFAAYLPYQTWEPRPVAGSAGLRPVSWHPALEAWGATQFQRRFERESGRTMRPEDYQVWMALRVLGEAATRTKSSDFNALRDYILSPAFELAAFKGQKLTFRPWNHQLRQPIILASDRVIVSVSPQEEFLHRVSRLDTLGTDEPETTCDLN
ncbi:branched-chain amino acid ABC transporter substrate-binding protein (plasmid) [Paroceanicella profunda]|uniref:Branched-chain amino acid ABC transporter substrate-binding protein n=1 Tax=Paroceanicella profunda TaxID=2579971 RepID=A0A5B8G1K0_9RHOB|nr:ABC transporter substrate-binding protein [Paroceanicella profunda]QDL93904.1 branched-chain amino acid ABC transporter substrate-binding protein [Paroceanicella profunda]